MSIADKLTRILAIKDLIRSAILEKGVQIDENTPFSDFPGKVQEIASASGTGSITLFHEGNSVIMDTLTLPDGLLEIQASAFLNMKIRRVYFNPELRSIGTSAFSNNHSLETIHVPSSVQTLSHSSFRGCLGLTQAIIDASASIISTSCFSSCSSLQTVHLSSSITELGMEAFLGCTSLVEINLENIKKMGIRAFSGCQSLVSFNADSLEEISGNQFFTNAQSLKHVNLGKVRTLPFGAITGASSLEKLIIPDTTINISGSAFTGLQSLKYIEIQRSELQNSLSIVAGAFVGLDVLEVIKIECNSPPGITNGTGSHPFTGIPETAKIYVPDESVDAYKANARWSVLANYIYPMSEFVMPTFSS